VTNPTACVLVIGNAVLSGRTTEVIVSTVNEVRARFDHVFATGGIARPTTREFRA
jgi:molybdopterin-biosynthesis enzyme MoeA-like protein